jgi:hypothetical protein
MYRLSLRESALRSYILHCVILREISNLSTLTGPGACR